LEKCWSKSKNYNLVNVTPGIEFSEIYVTKIMKTFFEGGERERERER
jgi:hypothetical protein